MTKLRISLIAAGLLFSLTSQAFTPDCCPTNYFPSLSPKLKGGFYLGVTGLYVRPSETGIGQVGDSWQFVDSANPQALDFVARDRSVNPRYRWAWGVQAGYDVPCTPYNIEANYLHMEKKRTQNLTLSTDGNPVSFASIFFTNGFLLINAPEGLSLAFLRSEGFLIYKLDQGDLKVGAQFVSACGALKLHASLGVRYAELKHDFPFNSPAILQSKSPGAPTILQVGRTFGNIHSDFKGGGPVGSLDVRYGLFYGLGLVGRFNSSLLVGRQHSNSFITSAFATVAPFTEPVASVTNRFTRPSIDHVLPNVDAKVALDFNYCFCNQSSLTLEAGYQASKYWDAFNLIRGDITSVSFIPQQRITDIVTTSFAIHGPYASLTYHL